MVTNDWCIIYSLWCTSHEHLVLSHPKNIRWNIVQPISKHIPTPSLVSFSGLSIIFIGWVFFSHESHLTGEPCDYFILSLIVARNYVSACMFCIVWCQQISIWNKQIESSIYLIKQVFLIWWSEKEQGTQKIKISNWGTGEHRDSFHRNKRMGTHWEGLSIFSYAKLLRAQAMGIICIWFWYGKSPFSLHVTSSYKAI